MAITANYARFLAWTAAEGVDFTRTLTLGHQVLDASPSRLRRYVERLGVVKNREQLDGALRRTFNQANYVDGFLKVLGADLVESVDLSNFEGATIEHDLNVPFPSKYQQQFDVVIDGGTLEHIFDFPRALWNCLATLRIGGHFIGISPADNQFGHGFYQFSPELFFRIFTAENGFE